MRKEISIDLVVVLLLLQLANLTDSVVMLASRMISFGCELSTFSFTHWYNSRALCIKFAPKSLNRVRTFVLRPFLLRPIATPDSMRAPERSDLVGHPAYSGADAAARRAVG